MEAVLQGKLGGGGAAGSLYSSRNSSQALSVWLFRSLSLRFSSFFCPSLCFCVCLYLSCSTPLSLCVCVCLFQCLTLSLFLPLPPPLSLSLPPSLSQSVSLLYLHWPTPLTTQLCSVCTPNENQMTDRTLRAAYTKQNLNESQNSAGQE